MVALYFCVRKGRNPSFRMQSCTTHIQFHFTQNNPVYICRISECRTIIQTDTAYLSSTYFFSVTICTKTGTCLTGKDVPYCFLVQFPIFPPVALRLLSGFLCVCVCALRLAFCSIAALLQLSLSLVAHQELQWWVLCSFKYFIHNYSK